MTFRMPSTYASYEEIQTWNFDAGTSHPSKNMTDKKKGDFAASCNSMNDPGTSHPSKNMTDKKPDFSRYCQYSTYDNVNFYPCTATVPTLPPGAYEIKLVDNKLQFATMEIVDLGLLRFKDNKIDSIILEIQNFWEKAPLYKQFNLIQKRGILLFGPPGSGKTCTLQLLVKDIIARNGIAVKFDSAKHYMTLMTQFRQVQPDTPVVCLMEDLDAILRANNNNESEVLNILDGVSQIDKVVYLATTNHPDLLEERLTNRPSRFDRREKIDFPNRDSREQYLRHIMNGKTPEDLGIDLNQWLDDTDKYTLAHLKELFTMVVIYDAEYKYHVERLSNMKKRPEDEGKSKLGFGGVKIGIGK